MTQLNLSLKSVNFNDKDIFTLHKLKQNISFFSLHYAPKYTKHTILTIGSLIHIEIIVLNTFQSTFSIYTVCNTPANTASTGTTCFTITSPCCIFSSVQKHAGILTGRMTVFDRGLSIFQDVIVVTYLALVLFCYQLIACFNWNTSYVTYINGFTLIQ